MCFDCDPITFWNVATGLRATWQGIPSIARPSVLIFVQVLRSAYISSSYHLGEASDQVFAWEGPHKDGL